MPRKFTAKSPTICVAVKFDKTSDRVLRIAEQLGKRMNAKLHLVHVCESAMAGGLPVVSGFSMSALPDDLFFAAQEGIKKNAESKMAALAKKMSQTIATTTHIAEAFTGTPAELVQAEALSRGCCMIVVGSSPGGHRFLPKGFSCALSLMAHGKSPVMVVNSTQTKDFGDETLRLMIADDLKAQTNAAVLGACELAFALGKTEITHFHVNSMTKEVLEGAIANAAAVARTPADADTTSDALLESVIQNLNKKLQTRTAGMCTVQDLTSCTYETVLKTSSSVAECLESFVQEKGVHLCVFGRHHAFHKKPFNIGQVPFYAALTLPCPVMIFPQEEEA